jgi:RNA polymerase sigma-70 factor (ECF subfamily)
MLGLALGGAPSTGLHDRQAGWEKRPAGLRARRAAELSFLMTGPLSQMFLAYAPPTVGTALASVRDLELRLERIVAEARRTWPRVRLATDVFLLQLAAKVDPGDDPISALDALRTADLYLARACGHGDPTAIALFEEHCLGDLDNVLARLHGPTTLADDVRQELRIKLLMPTPSSGPRILDYSARGDLRSWVRVAAVRTGLNLLRNSGRTTANEDEELLHQHVDDDPELRLLHATYREEFRGCFRDAVARLPCRDRNLLRQHYLDGVNMETLATLYRVHRITVVRWIATARRRLLVALEQRLLCRLGMDQRAVDSLLRAIQSRVDVSLRTLMS